MRTKLFLAAATMLGCAAVPATAGLMKADADGNGTVSLTEMNARTAERFARIDSDNDGFVTQAEMASHRAARPGRHGGKPGKPVDRFAERDANGDGRLSLAEFQAAGAARFGRLDGDRDGSVTRAEIARHRAARKGKHHG